MFCIDGSAVLSLLGLRECRDLDFIYSGDPKLLPQLSKKTIDCHNESEKYHSYNITEIIGDPRLHCWYMGIKFCTPEVIYQLKKNRNEAKDRYDIALLKSVISKPGFIYYKNLFVEYHRTMWFIRVRLQPYLNKIKALIRPIIRRT